MKMLERLLSLSQIEESLISPSVETPNHILCFTELDFMLKMVTSQLNVYQVESHEDKMKDQAKLLKDALPKVLDHYYPMAGRLSQVPDDQGSVVVNCNAEGVLFVQAKANCTLEDVFFLSHPCIPSEDSSLFAVLHRSQHVGTNPLLSIKVTTFKCGGNVVGIQWDHVLMDGGGLSQFLVALAETVKNNGEWLHSTLPKPIWERECLSARRPPQLNSVVKHHEERVPDEMYQEHLKSKKEMSVYTFDFPDRSVARLKARVVKESEGEAKFCSTFEAVTALIWKTYAEIMELHGDAAGYSLSGFKFSVDIKKALKKVFAGSPDGYYGNSVVNVSVLQQDLSKRSSRRGLSLWDVVRGIREEKWRVNNEQHVRSVIDYFYLEGKRMKNLIRKKLLSDEMTIYDWSKLVWLPDFGVGRAKCFIYPRVFPYPCVMFLPKGRGQAHISVKLGLPEVIMPLFKVHIEQAMCTTSVSMPPQAQINNSRLWSN